MRVEIIKKNALTIVSFSDISRMLTSLYEYDLDYDIKSIKIICQGGQDPHATLLHAWLTCLPMMKSIKIQASITINRATPAHIQMLRMFWQNSSYPQRFMIKFYGMVKSTIPELTKALMRGLPIGMILSLEAFNEISIIAAITALSKAPAIKNLTLILRYNQIKNLGAIALSKLLTIVDCQKIDLAHNEITDEGAIALSKVIAAGCTLKELNLAYNLLSDATAIYLACALKSSSCRLMRLTIAECEFPKGRHHSSDFIKAGGYHYLNNAILVNHTLQFFNGKQVKPEIFQHLLENENHTPSQLQVFRKSKRYLQAHLRLPTALITLIYEYFTAIEELLIQSLTNCDFSTYYYLQHWYRSTDSELIKREQKLFKLFLPDYIRDLNQEFKEYLLLTATDKKTYSQIKKKYWQTVLQWIFLLPQGEQEPFIQLCLASDVAQISSCFPMWLNKLFSNKTVRSLKAEFKDMKISQRQGLFIPNITCELKLLKKLVPLTWYPQLASSNTYYVCLANNISLQKFSKQLIELLHKCDSAIKLTKDTINFTVILTNVTSKNLRLLQTHEDFSALVTSQFDCRL